MTTFLYGVAVTLGAQVVLAAIAFLVWLYNSAKRERARSEREYADYIAATRGNRETW